MQKLNSRNRNVNVLRMCRYSRRDYGTISKRVWNHVELMIAETQSVLSSWLGKVTVLGQHGENHNV